MANERSYETAADVGGDPYVSKVSVVGPATEPFAWVPRVKGGVAAPPGVYVVCTNANTAYSLAVPTARRPKSLVGSFRTSAADYNRALDGRIGAAPNDDAIGTITGTDDELGYQDDTTLEYVLPDDITHIWFAAATAGRVFRGMWSYE
jgi:hypothetical protein